jgi:hypothetical protein
MPGHDEVVLIAADGARLCDTALTAATPAGLAGQIGRAEQAAPAAARRRKDRM